MSKILRTDSRNIKQVLSPNRSTIDQIHTDRQILEKCYEFGIELHNIFIDFKQTFYKVNRPKMYESLKLLKIPTKLIILVKIHWKIQAQWLKYIKGEQKCLTSTVV